MSKEKELAKYAVQITQIIKTNLDVTPGEVVEIILNEIPGLSVQDIIDYLTGVADRLKIDYTDVYGLIAVIQAMANDIEDGNELKWNDFFQSLAQGLLYVASLLKNILPKWATIILAIVTAYAELKGVI